MECGFLTFAFSGRNGAGPIFVAGVKVGDRIIWSSFKRGGVTSYAPPGTIWGFVVRAENAIEQVDSSDNSLATGEVLIFRGL